MQIGYKLHHQYFYNEFTVSWALLASNNLLSRQYLVHMCSKNISWLFQNIWQEVFSRSIAKPQKFPLTDFPSIIADWYHAFLR